MSTFGHSASAINGINGIAPIAESSPLRPSFLLSCSPINTATSTIHRPLPSRAVPARLSEAIAKSPISNPLKAVLVINRGSGDRNVRSTIPAVSGSNCIGLASRAAKTAGAEGNRFFGLCCSILLSTEISELSCQVPIACQHHLSRSTSKSAADDSPVSNTMQVTAKEYRSVVAVARSPLRISGAAYPIVYTPVGEFEWLF